MERSYREKNMFELVENREHLECLNRTGGSGECEKTMSKDGKDGKDDVSGVGFGILGGRLMVDENQ
ncbi:MAG: hypothetical protein VX737_06620 [Pseudomonadota bacterium]|nr:hypothetical protein [Pseudomonadota bacterium]